jgi:hypothetical protein
MERPTMGDATLTPEREAEIRERDNLLGNDRYFAESKYNQATYDRRDLLAALDAERKAHAELCRMVHEMMPPDPHVVRSLRLKSAGPTEVQQRASAWFVEQAIQVLFREMQGGPLELRNRVTIPILTGGDTEPSYHLTLARGRYESAMETQRNEARAERDVLVTERDAEKARADALEAKIRAIDEPYHGGAVAHIEALYEDQRASRDREMDLAARLHAAEAKLAALVSVSEKASALIGWDGGEARRDLDACLSDLSAAATAYRDRVRAETLEEGARKMMEHSQASRTYAASNEGRPAVVARHNAMADAQRDAASTLRFMASEKGAR